MPMARPYDATCAPWLRVVTILYLCWSLIPLLIAIVFSFNAAPSISRWEGFSLRWWVGSPREQASLMYDPELRGALLHSLTLLIRRSR
jgi:spermidine/putrescine transport system permease protein